MKVRSFDDGINAILADEMGLGKTLQTIAFLNYLKLHRGHTRSQCSHSLTLTPTHGAHGAHTHSHSLTVLTHSHPLTLIHTHSLTLVESVQCCAVLSEDGYRDLSCQGGAGVSGPHLVVCPLSVLYSWINEFKRWAPNLKVWCMPSAHAFTV